MINRTIILLIAVLFVGCQGKNPVVETEPTLTEDAVPEDYELVVESSTSLSTPMEKQYRLKYNFGEVDATSQEKIGQWPHVRQINWQEGWAEYSFTDIEAMVQRTNAELTHVAVAECYIYDNREGKVRYGYWERLMLNLPPASSYEKACDGYMDLDEGNAGLAYLIYQLSRESENIGFVWMACKSALFTMLQKDAYVATGYQDLVNGLLETHTFLDANQNIETRLDSMSVALNDVQHDNYDATGSEIPLYGPYVTTEIREHFGWGSDHEGKKTLNSTSSIWFPSFWVRRHREGNVETVLAILEEIQAHYAN
jgi:hypothetical protein